MGSDFSRCSATASAAAEPQSPPPTANVITAAGDLRRYPVPATASTVLEKETASSPSWFLCNADRLNYDESIPASDADEELQAGQIYFVLPRSMLQLRLSAADMAAMALKASAAIDSCRSKESRPRRRRRARISPAVVNLRESGSDADVMLTVGNELVGELQKSVKFTDVSKPTMMVRSGSVRRFQKNSSRRARTAVKSFKLRLSTIQEGTPL